MNVPRARTLPRQTSGSARALMGIRGIGLENRNVKVSLWLRGGRAALAFSKTDLRRLHLNSS